MTRKCKRSKSLRRRKPADIQRKGKEERLTALRIEGNQRTSDFYHVQRDSGRLLPRFKKIRIGRPGNPKGLEESYFSNKGTLGHPSMLDKMKKRERGEKRRKNNEGWKLEATVAGQLGKKISKFVKGLTFLGGESFGPAKKRSIPRSCGERRETLTPEYTPQEKREVFRDSGGKTSNPMGEGTAKQGRRSTRQRLG